MLTFDKKAVLSQRLPRDAPYSDRTIWQYAYGLLLESPFEPSSTDCWAVWAKIRQKRPSRGHRGETGSRNMAATQKIKRALMTSYRPSIVTFWPTVLSVEPLARCVVCRLSVTFCIVAKRYVLAKKCLKEWIGNQGQRVHFWGRRHISTSGFATTATETAVFALFLPVQPSSRY